MEEIEPPRNAKEMLNHQGTKEAPRNAEEQAVINSGVFPLCVVFVPLRLCVPLSLANLGVQGGFFRLEPEESGSLAPGGNMREIGLFF
jgi:hypothetical protein